MKIKSLLLLMLISATVFSQNTIPDSISNHENYAAFFDSIFKSQLDKKVFQGGAFVFVQNGKMLYKNGYGIYDAKKNTPVNPDSSIFYTASVSKIFASLSLMQLQQKGKCSMSDDVNKYLDKFKLDNPFSTSVTLKNLVTHTAGFEDRFTGGIVKNANEITPLEEYFSKRMPAIVMQPNTQISYSNHGAALAGLIVQKISGISYDEYVQQNIFNPLGMSHSSFFQPPPMELQKIIPKNERQQPFFNPYPAASCVTTATDMGKLIEALLSSNNSVLSESSLKQIFSQQWSANKNMPGMGYGFMQCWSNNLDAYFHTGDAGMHSELFIIPNKMTGFYVVYTNINENAENPREELTKKILDKFFPAPEFILPKPSADFAARANEYEGTFRINQYSRTNFEKIAALPNQGTCKNNGDGTLQLTLLGGSISEKLVEVSKDLFRADDNGYYAFIRDANGNIIAISIAGSISDPTGLEKIKWYDNTFFHLFIIAFVLIMILSRIIMSVIKRAKKLFKPKQEQTIQSKASKWAWKLPAIVSLLIISLPIIAFAGLAAIEKPFAGMPMFLQIVLNLLILVLLLGLIIIAFTVVAWKNKYWTKRKRIYYTVFSTAMLLLVWFINYWNL